MRSRILFGLATAAFGLLVGGLVGLAAAVVSVLNVSRPRQLFTWFIVPLFVSMVAATLFQGRLAQDMSFALARPVAHQLGLALAIALMVLAVGAPRPGDAAAAGS